MKNKKLARLLTIVPITEFIVIYLVNKLFSGAMKTLLFDIGIILLLLLIIFIKESEKAKVKLIVFTVLSIAIPVLFIFNLPATTYEGGKDIVRNEINSDDVTFIPKKYISIPITPRNSLFIKDYYYYYAVEVLGEKLFYIVDPADGSVQQLEQDYFWWDS
jgi:hypothetical protein